jgi:hypothetical protein
VGYRNTIHTNLTKIELMNSPLHYTIAQQYDSHLRLLDHMQRNQCLIASPKLSEAQEEYNNPALSFLVFGLAS